MLKSLFTLIAFFLLSGHAQAKTLTQIACGELTSFSEESEKTFYKIEMNKVVFYDFVNGKTNFTGKAKTFQKILTASYYENSGSDPATEEGAARLRKIAVENMGISRDVSTTVHRVRTDRISTEPYVCLSYPETRSTEPGFPYSVGTGNSQAVALETLLFALEIRAKFEDL